MKKLVKYTTGGKINNYIEDPSTALSEYDRTLAEADLESSTDPFVQGLNILSSLLGTAGNTMINIKGDKKEAEIPVAKYGGTIHIKPENKGKFNATKKRTGKTTEELTHSKNPLTRKRAIFAQNAAKWNKKALGGKVPVEVEGGESAETPSGDFLEFFGNSHAEGGILTELEPGTEVYSDRISIDGKTMSERKKARENKERKFKKLSDKGDAVAKKTLERVKTINAMEDNLDRTIQGIIAKQERSNPQKMSLGDKVEENKQNKYIRQYYSDKELLELDINKKNFDTLALQIELSNRGYKLPKSTKKDGTFDGIWGEETKNALLDWQTKNKRMYYSDTEPYDNLSYLPQFELKSVKGPVKPDKLPLKKEIYYKKNKDPFSFKQNMTLGDVLGIGGNLYQAVTPYLNTLRNRTESTPNRNVYANFGEDAIKANEQAMDYMRSLLDNTLQGLELSAVAQRSRGRNLSSGVNTQRAMDIASEMAKNKGERDIYNDYASQIIKLLGQRAELENTQDIVVMSGEEKRDLANRNDISNYISDIGQSKMYIGEGVSNIGKLLNEAKQRNVTSNLLNDLFQYTGFNPYTGKLEGKGFSKEFAAMLVKNGKWKEARNNPNTEDGSYSSLEEFKKVNNLK